MIDVVEEEVNVVLLGFEEAEEGGFVDQMKGLFGWWGRNNI